MKFPFYQFLCSLFFLFLLNPLNLSAQAKFDTTKPWTFWWWMADAVNKEDIKISLEELSKSGLGGVHIIPIYGAKGYESQFIPFLSEKWFEMVQYTIQEAEKLHLGVDLTLGTGWNFGGPWVDKQNAAKCLVKKTYDLKQISKLNFNTDSIIRTNKMLSLFGIVVYNDKGEYFNLSSQCSQKNIQKELKAGNWKLVCYGMGNAAFKVKRPALGGEGLCIDFFDKKSTLHYLNHFDSLFSSTKFPISPRALYHDSYELDNADWSSSFLEKFKALRGYDLMEVWAVPANENNPAILQDVRQTLSELMDTEFAQPWAKWSKEHKTITRYQAHGSPANLLDLYADSDIPETESFGCSAFSIPKLNPDPDYSEKTFGRPSPLMMKFASSPAHLYNKTLVSSETGTWLANHFKVSLALVKPQIDELFISGINHIFYHGTTYSPKKEQYPGWLFYASTNFGQSSHFFNEMPLLNSYVAECQKRLQTSTPDNDILLYFPINDLWTKTDGNIVLMLNVHKYTKWFSQTEFGKTADLLWDNGVSFDYVSDKQLTDLSLVNGKIANRYSAIVIPSIDYINAKTLKTLDSLAKKGVKIIFRDRLPENFAGYLAQKNPNADLTSLKTSLSQNANVKVVKDLLSELKLQGVRSEEMKQKGLSFIRKKNELGTLYFVTNLGSNFYQDSISLCTKSDFVEIFDPQTSKKGYYKVAGKIFLQLEAGKSCFIQTLDKKPTSEPWTTFSGKDSVLLANEWTVNFISSISGSTKNLKPSYKLTQLTSWTTWNDDSLKYFCGKGKYVSTFSLKNYDKSKKYQLVFDDINETASITINGVYCGTIWSLPYKLEIPAAVLKKENTIEIVVQNLSSNLIKKIDKERPTWKHFYDINIADITYKPFNADKWKFEDSGLVGKVYLVQSK